MFNQIDNSNNIYQCLQDVESFNLFIDSKKESISKSNKTFELIFNNIKTIFYQARLMPAFGVSLHNQTLNDLQTETWLEIVFSKEQIVNDLPFNSLLFKLDEAYGINLIRKYNNKYEGRCLYLDFMEKFDLKNTLLNQTKQKDLTT